MDSIPTRTDSRAWASPQAISIDLAAFVTESGTRYSSSDPHKETIMLHYAAVFFVIAVIAAIFGFTGIAVGAAEIAKVLFFVFLVLFVVSLIAGMFRRG